MYSNYSSGVTERKTQSVFRDGVTTWVTLRERDGCGRCRTGLFGESWGRPISSSEPLSDDYDDDDETRDFTISYALIFVLIIYLEMKCNPGFSAKTFIPND